MFSILVTTEGLNMKDKAFVKTMAATLVAATLGFGTVAQADSLQPAFAPGLMLAEAGPAEHGVVKLSDEGLQALRAIYAARLAIFEGHPKEAEKLLARARTELEAAAKTAAQLAFKSKKTSTDTLIPIDAQLSIADDFVFTPEKATQVAKLIGEEKFYEANLALKAAGDGVIVDSQGFLEWLEAEPTATKKG
jgi:hypothetical protein